MKTTAIQGHPCTKHFLGSISGAPPNSHNGGNSHHSEWRRRSSERKCNRSRIVQVGQDWSPGVSVPMTQALTMKSRVPPGNQKPSTKKRA